MIKMRNELTSVVIPAYNRESLIIDALDSVYEQTYRPLEVIVIDDGSTDRTIQMVRKWIHAHSGSDLFTGRLFCQENRGGNSARNRGIDLSAGKFIAFLDSDDVWSRDKLQKQISLFKEPSVGGVYCGVQHIDLVSGRMTASCNRMYPVGWILDQILVRDVTAPTSTFVVRKAAFDKIGTFDIKLQARQDWDMWIRLASAYEIQAVPENLVQYREHSGPRTASDPMREIIAYQKIRQKYATLLSFLTPRLQKAAMANYHKRIGRIYFHNNISTATAFRHYAIALLSLPSDFDTWAALLGIFLPMNVRQRLHQLWNRLFGNTLLAIRSH
jgi:glycosyltransferase involved in cell wall biosynthesis